MTILVANNAVGALASSINDSELTLVLETGQGALFPNPGAGEFFYATIIDDSNNREIVRVTARATNTLTIVRGQDGTSARAFSAGDRVELRPCKAVHDNYAQKDTAQTFTAKQTFSGDIEVDGLAKLDGNATVGGTLTVAGAATFNGALLKGANKVDAFPAAVALLFRQAAVPAGWTKDTTYNDAALRIVSGTPSQQATAGNEFTTLLTPRTISANNLPTHTHSVGTLTMDSQGAHTHTMSGGAGGETNDGSGTPNIFMRRISANNGTYTDTDDIQSSGAHTHTISGNTGNNTTSAEAMNFDVNYVDVYLATKDA